MPSVTFLRQLTVEFLAEWVSTPWDGRNVRMIFHFLIKFSLCSFAQVLVQQKVNGRHCQCFCSIAAIGTESNNRTLMSSFCCNGLLKVAGNDLVPVFFAHDIAVDLDAAREYHSEIFGVAAEHDILFEPKNPVLEFLGQGINTLN